MVKDSIVVDRRRSSSPRRHGRGDRSRYQPPAVALVGRRHAEVIRRRQRDGPPRERRQRPRRRSDERLHRRRGRYRAGVVSGNGRPAWEFQFVGTVSPADDGRPWYPSCDTVPIAVRSAVPSMEGRPNATDSRSLIGTGSARSEPPNGTRDAAHPFLDHPRELAFIVTEPLSGSDIRWDDRSGP